MNAQLVTQFDTKTPAVPGTRLLDLPAGERPRERLLVHGADALGIPELLAILLRTGVRGASAVELGRQLCVRFITLDALCRASVEELCAVKGLGRDKAVTLKAAFELHTRISREDRTAALVLDHPEAFVNQLRAEALQLTHERLWVFLLDSRRQLIRREILSDGVLDQVLIHAREVFRPAILANAHSLVLAHNHPSGDPTPSEADVKLTRDLVRVGHLLQIGVTDHIILGRRTVSRPVDWISLHQLGICA